MINILIGGDLCPTTEDESLFRSGDAESLFSTLLPEFLNSDFNIVNLECPLVNRQTPIMKDGPILGAHPECVRGLKAANIGAVGLANNHIMDHGEEGFRSTIDTLDGAGICHFGAGSSIQEAGKIHVRDLNGFRVGVLGVAEREFSLAGPDSWGANPIDVVELIRTIRTARKKCEFLIVLLHGGREYYRYPSPRLQKLCRFLVEEGCGAVVVQHTHIIGCYENYLGAPIVYGQGNLIFDTVSRKEPSWNEGLLIKLAIGIDRKPNVSWVPFYQSVDRPGIQSMPNVVSESVLREFQNRSEKILVPRFVQQNWTEYCKTQKYLYASRIRGHNRLLRVLNRYLHFSDWFYSKTTKMMQRNVVECEIHREVLETLWSDTDF